MLAQESGTTKKCSQMELCFKKTLRSLQPPMPVWHPLCEERRCAELECMPTKYRGQNYVHRAKCNAMAMPQIINNFVKK